MNGKIKNSDLFLLRLLPKKEKNGDEDDDVADNINNHFFSTHSLFAFEKNAFSNKGSVYVC